MTAAAAADLPPPVDNSEALQLSDELSISVLSSDKLFEDRP